MNVKSSARCQEKALRYFGPLVVTRAATLLSFQSFHYVPLPVVVQKETSPFIFGLLKS